MNKILKNFKNISYGPSPEDSKEVYKWISELNKPNYLYINGKFSNYEFLFSIIDWGSWIDG